MPAKAQTTKIIDLRLPDGRRVRARRRSGTGTPIVFLHGLLDSSEGWEEIAAASPRPSVAFDLPGFGGSDLPTRSRISAYAADIAAAMRHLRLRDVTLVGHSFGGAVAASLAERVPERVSSLVLLAPAGFGRIALAEAVSVPGIRNVAATLLPAWLGAPLTPGVAYRLFVTAGEPAPADLVERVRREASAIVPGALAATQAVVAAGRSARAFHRRRVGYDRPVTVLWGTLDRVVPPRHARGVTQAFPHAELESWSGMGHHPQRERPAQLSSFIEAACDRREPIAAVTSARTRTTVTVRPATMPAAA